MSDLEEHDTRWTVRRWLLYGALIFVVHLALLFWFARYQGMSPPPSRRRTGIELLSPARADGRAPFSAASTDPTVFALPTVEGFSGDAWLKLPPFVYQPTTPPAPPRWLVLAQEDLGDDFSEFVQTNLISEDLIAERLPAILKSIPTANPVFVAGTSIRLEGDLSGRQWQNPRRLPQAAEATLTNTIVRVSVDASGRTISAALLAACGIAKLDQEALEFSKSAHFGPELGHAADRAGTGIAFGALVFQWWRADWDKLGRATAVK